MERFRLNKLLEKVPNVGMKNIASYFPSIADRALRLKYMGVFLICFPLLFMNRYNLMKLGFHNPGISDHFEIKPDYLTGRLLILRRKDIPTFKYLNQITPTLQALSLIHI
eukprot:TRINITY_DN893_c0_g3_i1.p2 TRINITY_DN893_c0_g3~~TRINITY_DN893_c0_g3_i1.p2  ORF type:complete len:110 (-),score=11.05 TRINITY_DN893_c0_g3_i1:56-385(-)